MCKGVLKKVRKLDPMTKVFEKSSAATNALDPLDHYGYTGDRQNQQLAREEAEREAHLNEMQRQEEARRAAEEARRAAGVGRINELYDSSDRQAGYDKVRNSVLAAAMEDINRQKADAERAALFNYSRIGLYGGSSDIAGSREIADAYSRGILQANQLADNRVASIRSADEAARADFISRINAGMDADSAVSAATQALMNRRNEALIAPQSNVLSNLFAGIGNAWSGYQYGKAAANPYGAMQNDSPVNSVGLAQSYKGRLS